jgi:hypothetical protein
VLAVCFRTLAELTMSENNIGSRGRECFESGASEPQAVARTLFVAIAGFESVVTNAGCNCEFGFE